MHQVYLVARLVWFAAKLGMRLMDKKDCFAILDRVFPKGDQGLREVPPACLECPDRISCLSQAVKTKEGVEMRAQLLIRAERRGLIGRFRRWSQKKLLSRMANEEKAR
jgi:hypothetical protein